MLAAFLQKMFFKDIKVNPHARWVKRAKEAGDVEILSLARGKTSRGKNPGSGSGVLRALVIRPIIQIPQATADQDFCNCMADTVVVLAHPIHKKAKYFFTDSGRAQFYLNCGATVLLFDFNGFGESDRIDLFYWRDVRTVLDYVNENFPGKKINLHGASFGAFHVIRASSTLPPGSTLVLENVNKSLIDYWKRWPLTYFLASALEMLRVPSIRDMNVQAFLKSLDRPDLTIKFLACEKDTFTTVEEMQELFDVVPTKQKSFTVFVGASHLAANAKDKTLYQRILKKTECQIC